MRKLLIATHNQGKVREYRELLSGLPLEVTYLDAEGITREVEETGATMEENARLKASQYAELSGLWTWADDSGLEVDALGGAPGVYSARYAGEGATDADRYRKLLDALT
nr:non-canonical purine NTP pyrophosphatase [Anaerolineae bacterium]